MWLGLGTLYGDNELRDKMDLASVMRTIDGTLWKHFERFVYVFVLKFTRILQFMLSYVISHSAFEIHSQLNCC